MRLSAPSLMTVFVSFLMAIAAAVAATGLVRVPFISGAEFLTVLLAYLLLLAGILFRGL